VPHDGTAKVPVRLDAGGHKGVTGVQMARMRPVRVPVTQSGSRAACLGGGGNVGLAARMDHGDIQQCGTVGRGKGHFNPLSAASHVDCVPYFRMLREAETSNCSASEACGTYYFFMCLLCA
jgi:hypothetical protein